MSSTLFYLFLLTLFNFFFCQISQNYLFYGILNNNQYNISLTDNDFGNAFSLFLINKKEITLSFTDNVTYGMFIHNSDFPVLFNSPNFTGGHFVYNSFIECDNSFRLLFNDKDMTTCSLVGHIDLPDEPNDNPFSITFIAKEINEDDKEDDNDLIINVLIPISLVSLINLYYLLLLLFT